MSTHYVLGIVLGAGDKAENREIHALIKLVSVYFQTLYKWYHTVHTAHSIVYFSGSISNF